MARSPITWKNIDAPDFTGAAQIQELASRRLDKGFDSARGIIDTLRGHDTQVQQRNAADFNSRIAQQFQSPDALGAAQASGQIEALRQRYAANGGLDLATTGAGAITSLIDQGREREQGMEQHAMAQRLNESNLLSASQTRQQNAGRYADQQAATKKTAFEAEEAERLAILSGNSNASGMQQELDSGTLGRPDLWQAELRKTQTGAVNNAIEINKANLDYDSARASVAALPPNLQAAAISELDPLKKEAGRESVRKELVQRYGDEKERYQIEATDQLQLQEDFLKESGVDVRKAFNDDKYFNSLTQPQVDAYKSFIANEQATYNNGAYRNNDSDINESVFNELVARGMSREEAKTESDTISNRLETATGLSATAKREADEQRAELKRANKSNSLVRGTYDPVNEAGLQELVGEKYEKLQNLTGTAKKAADEVLGWIKKGEMPADPKAGRNEPWPLTTEMVKLAFNSTEGGQSTFWDTITPGTANVKERFSDFITSGVYDPDELKGLQQYQKDLNNIDRSLQLRENKQAGVVRQSRSPEQIAELEKRLVQSSEIAQGTQPGQTIAQSVTTQIPNNVQGPGEMLRNEAVAANQNVVTAQQAINPERTQAKVDADYSAARGQLTNLHEELKQALRIKSPMVPALEAQLSKQQALTGHLEKEWTINREVQTLQNKLKNAQKANEKRNDPLTRENIVKLTNDIADKYRELQALQAQLQGN